ncbi:MAG: RNA polymerase sigma factor [Dehalococcoidia bacterium]
MMERPNEEGISLIRRAKNGDGEAFNQLMDTLATRAYRIAFALLQNRSDAEDVVQEAFITAYNSIRKLKKEESFNSWFSRIVTTRAYDSLRKKQKNHKATEAQTQSVKEELRDSSSQGDPDFSIDLYRAMEQLPEQHRLAILLRYSKDASTEEIAEVLNRPVGTIRRILSESYRLLRLYLQGDVEL